MNVLNLFNLDALSRFCLMMGYASLLLSSPQRKLYLLPVTRLKFFIFSPIPDLYVVPFGKSFHSHKIWNPDVVLHDSVLVIANTMTDTIAPSIATSIMDDDHPLIPYTIFWERNGCCYPFSSIYCTRHVMRICWAVVSNSFEEPSPLSYLLRK